MEGRSCHDYCKYSQKCYEKGQINRDPDECPNAWKIEDLIWDAECDRRYEPRKEPEEPDDWEE